MSQLDPQAEKLDCKVEVQKFKMLLFKSHNFKSNTQTRGMFTHVGLVKNVMSTSKKFLVVTTPGAAPVFSFTQIKRSFQKR